MSSLPASIQPRLGSLLRLLGSPVDGEALGAARAIGRTLQGVGCDLHDLADTVEHPPAPMVIYRTEPAHQRRPRDRAYSPKPNSSIEWPSSRKQQARATLERGLRRGCLTDWEETFARSVLVRLYEPGMTLSIKQVDVLERLLAKIGASR